MSDLFVAGATPAELAHAGVALPAEGVHVTGPLPPEDYRALLRRARVFVCAPRREDYGLAQLEALADGCLLVTTPAPGPYAALPSARSLDPRLVGEDLGVCLRTALDDPAPDYSLLPPPRAPPLAATFATASCGTLCSHVCCLTHLSDTRATTCGDRRRQGWHEDAGLPRLPSLPALLLCAVPFSPSPQLLPCFCIGDVLLGQPRSPGGRDAPAHVLQRLGSVCV